MKRHSRLATLFTVVVLVFVGAVLFYGGRPDNAVASSPAPSASGDPVPFGDAAHPLSGDDDNQNPVLGTVQNWRQLVTAVEGKEDWYKQCIQDRIGVNWDQAKQFADLVDQGHDLRFILVSNSSVSDDQARQVLKGRGINDVDNLPIKRLNGFNNTRGLPEDRCQAFGDARSQVRVSLAVPIDPEDLSKGIHDDKGVLAMCSNPWNLLPEQPVGPTPNTPTENASPPASSPPGETPPPSGPPGSTPPSTPPSSKPPTSFDCQQNGTGPNCPFPPVQQPPQHNPCCDTGPTPGAPSAPNIPPRGPTPQPGTPAPNPTPGGSDSGSGSGSGTPGGSTCNNGGTCQGGGPTPPSGPPVPVDTGPHNGDPGGF